MFQLRCTVRNCSESLQRTDDGLTCVAGHHFDRAREGYWNLTQPQDKRSLNPGDSDQAVLARSRWLERGYAQGLVVALQQLIEKSTADDENKSASQLRALDLGCGEGTFGPALFSKNADSYCGIDLSKRAIKLAARRWPQATWVLANADRGLPVADRSVDCIVSVFGRRPIVEIKRVLSESGFCIVAVPGEDDLLELREQVQETGQRRSRWEAIAEEMSVAGLGNVDHRVWRTSVELHPDAIADAMAMTYRAVRHSQHSRLVSLASMKVTLSADLLLFRNI